MPAPSGVASITATGGARPSGAALAPGAAPSLPAASDNTMTGGLGLEVGEIAPPSLRGASPMTLSGGLGYDAQSVRGKSSDAPDMTLTGGIGAPAPARQRSQLARGKRFDDFVPSDFQEPAPARKVIQLSPAPDSASSKSMWKVGDLIEGKYEVTAIAGQGGMGVVYKIHHREWNIDMAVKTPLPALVKDAAAKARFLREAQIWVDLGLHPNLVQCWYVRELSGLPRVFVDYLGGGSLKDWFQKGRIGPGKWAGIIDLMVQACDGLGYAHERGVVHRDIKPGNMLMREDGQLCITDFGLVKVAGVEDIESDEPRPQGSGMHDIVTSDLTRTGLSLGTPQYGAPEQWGKARHVDARADIYALGITLYELCCGRRPFDESGKGEPAQVIIARHLSVRPPDPRSHRKDLPAPLAELALKCLEKDPAKRPQTLKDVRDALAAAHAKILGTPLERETPEIAESRASGLNNRAVSMWDLGQPAQAEAAWREALELDPRHPESIYNSSLLAFRAGRITDFDAVNQLREAAKTQRKAHLYLGYLFLETCNPLDAEKALQEALDPEIADPTISGDGHAWRALGHAKLALEKYRDAEAAYLKALQLIPVDDIAKLCASQARACQRARLGRCLHPNIGPARVIEDRIGSVRAIAVAPDGRSLFSDGALNSVCQFELPTGRQANNFSGHTKQVLCVAPTPDGKHLICGGEDSILRMWTLDTGFIVDDFYGKGHIGSINALAVSADSSTAITGGSDKSVRVWELGKGTLLRTLWGHDESVTCVAFSPGEKLIVSGGSDATIRVWEMPSGKNIALLKSQLTPLKALVFAPDGKHLYSAGSDGRLLKWDCQSWVPVCEFKGHRGTVNSLALVPAPANPMGTASLTTSGIISMNAATAALIAGRFLISGGDDNTLRIWDTNNGHCLRTITGHQGAVNAVAVTPDATQAVSGASENLGRPLRLWNLELDRYTRDPSVSDPYAGNLVVCRVESQDKSQSSSRQFKTALQNALSSYENAQYAASYAWLKKARKVEGYERDPRALALNAQLCAKLPLKSIAAAYLRNEIEGRHPHGFRAVVFAANGQRAISAGRNDKALDTWDLSTGTFVRALEGHKQAVEAIAITPDSASIVSASSDFTVGLWDAVKGQLRQTLQGHRGEVNALSISRDGRVAATVSSDCSIKLWDIASGRCIKTLAPDDGSDEPFVAVRYLPDSRGVVTGGRDGSVRLWSTVTGKCTRTFDGHSGAILDLAVLLDRPQFLSAGEDKTLRLWNLENGQNLWIARDGQSRFHSLAMSVDNRFVFSGGMEGLNSMVKIWEAASGKLLHSICPHTKGISCLALSSDNCHLLTGSEDKYLRVWDLEWELLSTDPLSALTGQAVKISGVMQASSGAFKRPTQKVSLPRKSIFIKKEKPKE